MLVLEELSKMVADPAMEKMVIEYDVKIATIVDIAIAVGIIAISLFTAIAVSFISWFTRKEIPRIVGYLKKFFGRK